MKTRSSLLLLALLVGCADSESSRPKTYRVSGTVTVNGQPVEGATVNFLLVSGQGSAIGVTDSNGQYSLTTFSADDGAVPGEYKVAIFKYEGAAAPKANTPPQGQLASGELDAATYAQPNENAAVAAPTAVRARNEISEKYANADSSGLQATIDESDDNVKNFDLK